MWNNNDKIMELFYQLNDEKNKFPCVCPICNNQAAHIYIHSHNEKHAGVWMWCSHCESSSHMSINTPNWWENPDFVDEEQLSCEPDYLESLAGKIDEWINNIPAKGNIDSNLAIVMENKFKVKFKKTCREIPAGTVGTIVVRDDFKSVKIEFIGSKGEVINIPNSYEDLTEIVDVIN